MSSSRCSSSSIPIVGVSASFIFDPDRRSPVGTSGSIRVVAAGDQNTDDRPTPSIGVVADGDQNTDASTTLSPIVSLSLIALSRSPSSLSVSLSLSPLSLSFVSDPNRKSPVGTAGIIRVIAAGDQNTDDRPTPSTGVTSGWSNSSRSATSAASPSRCFP